MRVMMKMIKKVFIMEFLILAPDPIQRYFCIWYFYIERLKLMWYMIIERKKN